LKKSALNSLSCCRIQRPVLPNRMTLVSDMHICTFLHILMFLLASSQQVLEVSTAIASPAGFQKQRDAD